MIRYPHRHEPTNIRCESVTLNLNWQIQNPGSFLFLPGHSEPPLIVFLCELTSPSHPRRIFPISHLTTKEIQGFRFIPQPFGARTRSQSCSKHFLEMFKQAPLRKVLFWSWLWGILLIHHLLLYVRKGTLWELLGTLQNTLVFLRKNLGTLRNTLVTYRNTMGPLEDNMPYRQKDPQRDDICTF